MIIPSKASNEFQQNDQMVENSTQDDPIQQRISLDNK